MRENREENLEAKARKRLAREQKAKYAALGIEPPPTLNTGRRRWEYNIRFQQQKLNNERRGSSSSSSATPGGQPSEPAGAPEALGDYSPEGFSTSTWRVGDMVRQAASHPAAVPTPAETRREYYGQVKPQGGEWAASTTTTMRAKYLDSQPGRRASGPVAAYSPYPLTPPMEDYHPGETAPALSVGASAGAGGNSGSGLGMYAAEEGSWMLPPSMVNGAGTSRPDPTGSHFSSWQSQRTITVQRVPKSLAQVQHVPVEPTPLLPALPPVHHHLHHHHHHHSEGGPYPTSPHGGGSSQQQQLFPTGLPAPVSVQPPPVPLYAPFPTRPARTCSFIQQVGSPAPPSSETGSPHAPHTHAAPASSEWCLPPPVEPYPPAVQGPSLILSPPDHPQHAFHHQHHQHQHQHHYDGAPQRDSPAISAAPMLPSTNWNGSLYATPVMRQVGSFQGDEWSGPSAGDQQPHSTPDLYSQTGW